MAVSFIGRWNRSTQRKPPTCPKSLTNFIIQYCIKYTSPWADYELLVVIGTDCIVEEVRTKYCIQKYSTFVAKMKKKHSIETGLKSNHKIVNTETKLIYSTYILLLLLYTAHIYMHSVTVVGFLFLSKCVSHRLRY
jgi:hypothetical protein